MLARGRHLYNSLTVLILRRLRPRRHADGEGLYLFKRPSGTSQSVQRMVIDGRRRGLGLWPNPRVSLAAARRVALDNRRLARAGSGSMLDVRCCLLAVGPAVPRWSS